MGTKATDGKRAGTLASDILTRVGVVEIGSRATRLLVADVSNGSGLEPVLTRVENTKLMERAEEGESGISRELTNISVIVTRFREQAIKMDARRCFVFGTEAIRQISSSKLFLTSPLADAIDEILDARAEAECSLIAGIMALKASKLQGSEVLVIDQGAGSMELATGRCGPPVQLLDFSSQKLGGNTLLRMFRDHRLNVGAFSKDLFPILDECKLPTGHVDHVIIQGTVATKCAWLTERLDKRERYDLRRVHGRRLNIRVLNLMISAIEKFSHRQWAEFQDFVNPGEAGGDAGERVASGVIPLLQLLKRLNKEEFVVSGYGTRHGMCLRLARAASSAGEAKKGTILPADGDTQAGSKDSGASAELAGPLSERSGRVEVLRIRSKRRKK
jgi:exopolyphosphatase/pppGpp-phosphohydrolase